MKRVLLILLLLLGCNFSLYSQQTTNHTVAKGDTVYNLAKRYGTTTDEIYRLNPEARNGITLNAVLKIPSQSAGSSAEVPPKPFTTDKDKLLKAKEVENILESLDVPAVQPEPVNLRFRTHKVRRKETLYSIARKYKITVDDVKKYNKRLYAEKLRKGDKIKIPQYDASYLKNKINGTSELSNTTKYNVKPQETRFGIARRHGITIAQLKELNPEMGETLSINQEIVVPTAVLVQYEEEKDPRFRLYEVRAKETIYSLSRESKITPDSLNALNPFLKIDGLRTGMILRIPGNSTLDSLMINYTGNAILKLEDRLVNFKPKKVALMLPFNLDKIELDSIASVEGRIKRDKVLKISLDFYSGAILAAEEAKEKGITTDITVYDTENSKSKILDHIRNNNFNELDAVIGPLYQKNTETVAKELKSKEIPIFSPISNKESKLYNNFFQTRPSESMVQEKLISYILKDSLPKNIIIIADDKHEAIKTKLKEKLPGARFVTPQEENFVLEADIIKVLDPDLRNWVILETNSIPLISNVTPYLNARVDTHKVQLFTTEKNVAYDSEAIDNSHLSNLQLLYPSIDKEYDDTSKNSFIKKYTDKYKMSPSRYAVRGHDIMLDILLRLTAAENLYQSTTFEGTTEYVENKFNYAKKTFGGYYNKALYLIKYDKDLKLTIVE